MGFNAAQKLKDNIAAIRLALAWDGPKQINCSERGILQKFVGFGGLKAVLYPRGEIAEWQKMKASEADLRLYPLVMELHDLLESKLGAKDYEAAVNSLEQSTLTAF